MNPSDSRTNQSFSCRPQTFWIKHLSRFAAGKILSERMSPIRQIRQLPAHNNTMKYLLTIVCLLAAAAGAHAATLGGGGLPWETPLNTLSNSVTGPVAYGISLIGIVGAGGVLIFAGGMVNEFLRAVLFCVLVIAFIIASKNTLGAFGFANASGAEVPEHYQKPSALPSQWHYDK
jgi:type IV secretion system protein TrbC